VTEGRGQAAFIYCSLVRSGSAQSTHRLSRRRLRSIGGDDEVKASCRQQKRGQCSGGVDQVKERHVRRAGKTLRKAGQEHQNIGDRYEKSDIGR
jgi:hypothetical protein